MNFPLPPVTQTEQGAERRVGIELEMHELTLEELTHEVADWTGGSPRFISSYEAEIVGDEAGPWKVEFDYEPLKQKGREQAEQPAGKMGQEPDLMQMLDETAEEVLHLGAALVLPMEIVSPPLPLSRLHQVDDLIGRLRTAGAQGTGSNLVRAFGTHLNPELPALDAGTIVGYLRAFLCLYPWLRREHRLDLARRITNFIEPFDSGYTRQVCDPDYWPDQATLIDEYLEANPTRNRALDMLPLFAYLDEDRVRQTIDDDRIKARPTFHYRMPNCEIDRPGWAIGEVWRPWVEVEKLAADEDRLGEMCAAYTAHLDSPVDSLLISWTAEVDDWLDKDRARS